MEFYWIVWDCARKDFEEVETSRGVKSGTSKKSEIVASALENDGIAAKQMQECEERTTEELRSADMGTSRSVDSDTSRSIDLGTFRGTGMLMKKLSEKISLMKTCL